jgi:ATP-dependent DNA helicase RecQ
MREPDFLQKSLKTYFGFDSFKGNQEAIIRSVMDDMILRIDAYRSGKSLCYQLPFCC